jgi:hypothetical protein
VAIYIKKRTHKIKQRPGRAYLHAKLHLLCKKIYHKNFHKSQSRKQKFCEVQIEIDEHIVEGQQCMLVVIKERN